MFFFQNVLDTANPFKINQFYFQIYLSKQNILKFYIPTMSLDDTFNSPFHIVFRQHCEDQNKIISSQKQKIFLSYLLNNRDKIISNSKRLLNDLTENPKSRFLRSLKEKDYILTFFDRNYDKTIKFFKCLILLLQESDKLSKAKLFNFFINFIKENLNEIWQYRLGQSGMDLNTFKDLHLLNCFFMDIQNLLRLVSFP